MSLQPGQAIYIPAGELHAYLKGVGMELMANSDNVLRGGLTPKYVDVPELIKIVCFDPCQSLLIDPEDSGDCERIYLTPAEEFQLSEISVREENSFMSAVDRNVEILICMEGEARIGEMQDGFFLEIASGEVRYCSIVCRAIPDSGKSEIF